MAPMSAAAVLLAILTTVLADDLCHWTSERLPSTFIPRHYNLTLRPQSSAGTFTGTVDIDAQAVAASRCIVLHTGPNLTISSMAVQGSPIASWRRNATSEMLTLELERELPAGPVVLRFEFSSSMHNSFGQSYPANRGLYRIPVNDSEGRPSWMAISELWAVEARTAFPCFDEPTLKAKFSVSLEVPAATPREHMTSNMPLAGCAPLSAAMQRCWFETSPLMPTYLQMILFSPLKTPWPTTKSSSGVPVNLLMVPEGAPPATISLTLAAGAAAIDAFEHLLEVPYPLPKLDLIAVPSNHFGGLEAWGAIEFKGSSVMPSADEPEQVLTMCSLVAHEIAHMWFGDLVTGSWWDQMWLNEGMAQFFQWLGCSHAHPELHYPFAFFERSMRKTLIGDANLSQNGGWAAGGAVVPPVECGKDTWDARVPWGSCSGSAFQKTFVTQMYDKGAAILRMLQLYIERTAHWGFDYFKAPTAFFKGQSLYLKSHYLANANTSDWFAAMAEATGEPIESMLSEWLMTPGFPLVMAELREQSQEVVLTQQPFNNSAPEATRWWIPVSYITRDSPDHARYVVLSGFAATSIHWSPQDENDWIKLNVNASAFLRVSYTQDLWRRLEAPMKDGVLNKADVATLSFDAALVRSDHEHSEVKLSALHDLPVSWPSAAFVSLLFCAALLVMGAAHRARVLKRLDAKSHEHAAMSQDLKQPILKVV